MFVKAETINKLVESLRHHVLVYHAAQTNSHESAIPPKVIRDLVPLCMLRESRLGDPAHVLNEDYEQKRIKIAFNPLYEGEDTPFAVLMPVIGKDPEWIPDVSALFQPGFDSWTFVNDYIAANDGCDPKTVNARITDLIAIATRQLGVIVVNASCTVDEVTDIFIRINSKGVVLSQADFAMSKIAADETHGGNMLLTGRYSGSSESVMDRDIRLISERGFLPFYDEIVRAQLSDTFWEAAPAEPGDD